MTEISEYIYQPLDPQFIRVLELQPALPEDPLRCKIVAQLINGLTYDALSYVWGDPTPVTTIKCHDDLGEGELRIGKGLASALHVLRLPDKIRRIWIDALCVNQQDMAERSSQVRLMGAVYRSARYVLCWLGPFVDNNLEDDPETRARLAIRFIRKFNQEPYAYLHAAREYLLNADTVDNADDPLVKSWLAVKDLFDIEYFHRVWIIQEVGLACRTRFYWGTQDTGLDWKEVASFSRFMDDNGASIISHFNLKSWVANHINLVWEITSSGEPVHSFIEVLHWARVHRSTDPRDYVYALLSHPSAKVNGKLIMQPNYSISAAEAFTELALNVIERTNSLQILAFVDHHEEPGVIVLPSWVPDWHALNLVAPIRCSTKGGTDTTNSMSFIRSENTVILKAPGVLIDTVRTISDMINHTELTVTTLERETKKQIPFLIDHIWRKTVLNSGSPLPSMSRFLSSLGLVLTGGFLNELNSTSGKSLEQQKSDLAAIILEYERIRDKADPESYFENLSSDDKIELREMAATGSAHQFVQDMTWTSMCRKVFRTSQGHLGLGPRIMRTDDICVLVQGATFPMIMRRRDDRYQLIGPALIYGFMNGEAEEQARNGTLVEQEFEII